MNIQLLSHDIASRIPIMAQDSVVNNAQLIQGLIEQELARTGAFEEYVKWFVGRRHGDNPVWTKNESDACIQK